MEIKQKAVKGIMWAGLSSVLVQVLKFISRVVLARVLFPSDFGLMAISLLVMNGLSLFRDLGIGTALVYWKEELEETASTAFWIFISVGLILFSISYFSAPFIAGFYGLKEIEKIITVLSFTFLISIFEGVPSAILSKKMEFKKKVFPEVFSEVVYTVITIGLAASGFGVWSLVYGYVGSVFVNAVLMWRICGWRPSLCFKWDIAVKLLGYGRHVICTGILAFIFLQGDKVFISKMVSTAEVGYYTLAYMLANMPSLYVTHMISKVSFPTFCKLQNDIPRLKKTYFKTVKFCWLIIIPMCVGGIILGDDIVRNILGYKWMPIVTVFKLLCFSTIVKSIHTVSGFLFQAVGRPDLEKNLLFVETIIILLLLYPLIKLSGILGAAIAVTVVLMAGSSWALWRALRFIDAKPFEMVKQASAIIRAGFIMSIALIVFKLFFMPVHKTNFPGFVLLVAVGAVCYIISVCNKDLFAEIREVKNILFESS